MPCSPCAASGSLCYFSDASVKCSECVRCGVQCDGNFSADDFDRLHAEQEKLERARQDALERAAKDTTAAVTLGRRIEALRKAKGKMIERESRSLAELEREEERQAQQTNVALDHVFNEQQLAAFFRAYEESGSGGGNP
jgi:Zn ribbon nucleic-acid-binding protein